MSNHVLVSDAFFLSGEPLDRLRQALKSPATKLVRRSTAVTVVTSRMHSPRSRKRSSINSRGLKTRSKMTMPKPKSSGEAERVRRTYFPHYEAV